MTNIHRSTRDYEAWLRKQLDGDIVKKDLAEKHERMTKDPFVFLRATYWRWAETILEVCPDLGDAPAVLAVGDIHLENFGTWRDADGRLVWGVNDFDEAATMPFALDLVRLAASAILARGPRGISSAKICSAILSGYREGLQGPHPIVLDQDYAWLRELVEVPEEERAKFWEKHAKIKAGRRPPQRYRRALLAAMPEASGKAKIGPRTAGTGSLGRPRWVAVADWRGGPVIREAKAVVISAWARLPGRGSRKIRCGMLAGGVFRAPDPWYRVADNIAVRRLSPNNRKIEVEDNISVLLRPDMLQTMGFELANTHLGTADRHAAIERDLRRRKQRWLLADAERAADAVTRDHKQWKAG
jgi:hypothetical protein